MTAITSAANPRLRSLRRLQGKRERERCGRFLAEGEDLIDAARRADAAIVEGYRVAGSELGGAGFLDVEPSVLRGVSTLGSGARVIGVYEQRWSAPLGPLCVYLHGVGDPGNVGTILRSAEAFGAGSVVFGPGTADPYAPKAVRASMGAVFTVPLAQVAGIQGLPGLTVALVAGHGPPLHSLGLRGDVTLMIGSERDGLPDDLVAAADHVAQIPVANHSLNAAMAATVALYEATRMARE